MPLLHLPFPITTNLQNRLHQSGAKFAGQPSEEGVGGIAQTNFDVNENITVRQIIMIYSLMYHEVTALPCAALIASLATPLIGNRVHLQRAARPSTPVSLGPRQGVLAGCIVGCARGHFLYLLY